MPDLCIITGFAAWFVLFLLISLRGPVPGKQDPRRKHPPADVPPPTSPPAFPYKPPPLGPYRTPGRPSGNPPVIVTVSATSVAAGGDCPACGRAVADGLPARVLEVSVA